MISHLKIFWTTFLLCGLTASICLGQNKAASLTLDQQGIDTPHWDNGMDCQSCHTLHHSAGIQLTSVEGNANLCMSCHNPTGFAQAKPFTNADRAVPGVSGTSHAWHATAENPPHGAQAPQQEEMAKRLFNGEIVCSTCHNQHSQEFGPFLRASNFQNALCKECHAVRNVGSYRDSPNNLGSHPVGIPYPGADSLFFGQPLSPNLGLIDPDRVECMTCHGVHFTDSGGANEGAGDGYLLNLANDDGLCQSCHVFTEHMGQGCRKCHQPHDPDRTNILLVTGEIATPNSGPKPVVFTAESGLNSFADGDTQFDGVCEVCHTTTNYHRNDGTGQPHSAGAACTQCHLHSKSFLPPPCVECHNQVQDDGDGIPVGGRRAIAAEFEQRSHHVKSNIIDDDCKVCHDQASHMDGYVDLNDPDGGAAYRAISFQDGPPAQFCLNCHDNNGASAHGGLKPFSDNHTVPDVSQFYTSSGHGKSSTFGLLLAQGPITDPMSGNAIPLYSENTNPPANLECGNCHGTHGADIKPILKFANDQDNTLCSQCHPTANSATGYYLTAFNRTIGDYETSDHKHLRCTRCHNPHGSGNPGMTLETGDQLCLKCHSDKSLFRDLMLDINYDHGNTRCSNCHNPHSTGNEPFLFANLNEDPNDVCTDAVGQDLPVLANPSLDLAFCFACHVDANTAGSHDPSRCFACHGWYDPNTVLGQACGMADVKKFIDFKVHDEGDAGAPVDLGFSGLCLDCHFCGGDCGVNSTGTPLANKDGKLGDDHPQGANCEACHKPHENQTNYPPVIIANNDLTLDEQSVNRISRKELRVSDAESVPFDVIFTLKATPQHGELEIGGSSLAKEERFTQADIDRGLLSYQHDGSETTSDHFDFDADDSNGGLIENARFSIVVTPVNDIPVLRTNNAFSLDEAAAATLSRDELEIFDEDNPAQDLVLTLVSVPANGKLSVQGQGTLDVGRAFTQVDVNEGRVTYEHDGGETTGDDFDFEFSDGQSSRAATTFEIIVEPVNDSPELVLNETLQLDEGNLAAIDAEHLLVQDIDNSSDEIRFVLKELPANGTVLRRSRPLTSKNNYFTQADIATGSVSYRHDGGETTADEFEFEVFDGDGGRLRKQTFALAIIPVNDIPEVVVSGELSVHEGAETLISANDLRVSDAESDANEIIFTITEFPSNGKLKIDGRALDTEAAFSQDDINLGKLSYEHNGSETNSDAFKYGVADGDGARVAGNELAITVAPLNDLPTLVRNKTLTLDEGKARDLSDSRLHVTDVDNSPDELVFIITRAPAHGMLSHEQSGDLARGGAFTQADLDNDRIRYQHDGSETTRDRFDFDVNDGAGGEIKDQTFQVKVNPVNDLPVLAKNSRTTLDEGDTKTISDSRLQVTDAESDAKDIVFTLESPASEGVLELDGRMLGEGDSFSQENLDDNDLKYVHSGSEADRDEFEFSVSDGDGGQIEKTDHRLRIRPVNDAPLLAKNLGMTLDENTTAVVDTAVLQVTDADNDSDELDFRVVAPPMHGRLLRRDSQLSENDKFTQEDLDRNRLQYSHDGSETTLDSLVFKVDDGDGGRINERAFYFTILSINDPPLVTVPAAQDVVEDSMLAVAGLHIADDDAAEEVVQLTASVADGILSLANSQGVTLRGNGTSELVVAGPLPTINALLLDSLQYRPNPNFDGRDNIVVTVDDMGHSGQGGAKIGRGTIIVNVVAVNDPLVLEVNAGISLDEGDKKKITRSRLAVTDVDNSPDEIRYTLTKLPANGSLKLDGRILEEGQSFTQADIDAEDLRYHHDGSETTEDRLLLNVSDGAGGAIDALSFRIEIRPVNDPPLVMAPGHLDGIEDSDLAIPTIEIADDDVGTDELAFTATVEHGVLLLPPADGVTIDGDGSPELTVRGPLDDLNSALDATLTYRPVPDFAGDDRLSIRVDDQGSSGEGGAEVGSARVALRIAAVNDPPELTTNTGLGLSEGETVLIRSGHLEVRDADNGADELLFVVRKPPTNGDLSRNSRTLGEGDSFTQQDIESSRLSYAHDGGETNSDQFGFSVDDGDGGRIDETTFSMNIELLNDPPALVLPERQEMEEDRQLLLTGISVSDADARDAEVELVLATTNGALTLGSVGAVDLEGNGAGQITARGSIATLNVVLNDGIVFQPDLNFDGADTLTATVNDLGRSGAGGPQATTGRVPIEVQPINDPPVLSVNRGVAVDEGESQLIRETALRVADPDNDADELVFSVLLTPGNGDLEVNGRAIAAGDDFTQALVSDGRVRYRHDGSETTEDSLVFSVSDGAGGAIGSTTLAISVTPVNDAPRLAVPGPQNGIEDGEIPIPAITISDADVGSGGMEMKARVDNGTLSLSNSPGAAVSGSGTANLVIKGSLDDLTSALDGTLLYRPDADFDRTDNLTLTLSDNGNSGAGGAQKDTKTVKLRLRPVNDPPLLTVNTGLSVDEDTTALLTSAELLASDVDHDTGQLVFTVMTAPANGALLLDGIVPLDSSATFTQENIDKKQVVYRHDGSETKLDSVVFDFTDGESPAQRDSALIAIRPMNDPPSLSAPAAQTVVEDAELVIPAISMVDNDAGGRDLKFIARAESGVLSLAASGVTVSGSGSSEIAVRGSIAALNQALDSRLVYRGQADFAGDDNITFILSDLGNSGYGGVQTATRTTAVAVQAVNDAPILAISAGLTVDEGGMAVVARTALLVTDVDNSVDEIVFTLEALPDHGILALGDAELSGGDVFTQADVDGDRLGYQHDGGETTADSFVFHGSDGAGAALDNRTFSIVVTPVNDPPELTVNDGIEVDSAGTVTILPKHLHATDKDNATDELIFVVVRAPENGQLFLDGATALAENATFSQRHIDQDQLTYQNGGGDSTDDSFDFVLRDGAGAVTGTQRFRITVKHAAGAVAVSEPESAASSGGFDR